MNTSSPNSTTPTQAVTSAQILAELREWHADTLLLAERVEIFSRRMDALESRAGEQPRGAQA